MPILTVVKSAVYKCKGFSGKDCLRVGKVQAMLAKIRSPF